MIEEVLSDIFSALQTVIIVCVAIVVSLLIGLLIKNGKRSYNSCKYIIVKRCPFPTPNNLRRYKRYLSTVANKNVLYDSRLENKILNIGLK